MTTGLQRRAGDELEAAVGPHQPDEADRQDVEHRQHVPQLGEAAPQQAGRAVAEDRLGEAGAILQHEDDEEQGEDDSQQLEDEDVAGIRHADQQRRGRGEIAVDGDVRQAARPDIEVVGRLVGQRDEAQAADPRRQDRRGGQVDRARDQVGVDQRRRDECRGAGGRNGAEDRERRQREDDDRHQGDQRIQHDIRRARPVPRRSRGSRGGGAGAPGPRSRATPRSSRRAGPARACRGSRSAAGATIRFPPAA